MTTEKIFAADALNRIFTYANHRWTIVKIGEGDPCSDGQTWHNVVIKSATSPRMRPRKIRLVGTNLIDVEVVETPADGPIRTQDAGDGVKVVEDARLVVRVAVAEGTSYPWLRADNAAKAYAKEFGNGAKLVRKSVEGGVYVYNWSA